MSVDRLPRRSSAPSGGLSYEDLEEEVGRLGLLNDITNVIATTIDLESVFRITVSKLSGLIDFDRSSIAIYDSNAKLVIIQAVSESFDFHVPVGTRFPPDQSVIKSVFFSRLPILSNDLAAEENADHLDRFRPRGIRSQLIMPIIGKATVLGALDIASREPYAFGSREMALLSSVTERLAFAIENAQRFQMSERKHREVAGLHRLSQILSGARKPSEGYEELITVIAGLMSASAGVLILRDRPLGRIRLVEPACGLNVQQCAKLQQGLDEISDYSQTLRTGIPARWTDPARADGFGRQLDRMLQVKSIVAVPLSLHGELMGAIYCAHQQRWFDDEDIRLLSIFALHAAEAISNFEYYKRIQQQAERERLLNQITTAINRSLVLDEILQAAVNELGRATGASLCQFSLSAEGQTEQRDYTYEPVAAIHGVQTSGQALVSVASRVIEVETDNLELEVFGDGGLVGRLGLRRSKTEPWAEDDRRLAEAVAGHLSVAIKNSELYRETRTTARHLALLNQISTAARRGAALSDLLEITMRAMGRLLNVTRCQVLLCSVTDEFVNEAQFYSETQDETLIERIPVSGNPFFRRALNEGQTFSAHDVEAEPLLDVLRPIFRPYDVKSIVASPLLNNGGSVGLLCLWQSGHQRCWTTAEIGLVQALADQIAGIIEQMRLHENLDERAREAVALYQATDALALSLNLDGLLNEILRVMREVLGYQSGAVLLINEERTEIYARVSFGHDYDLSGWRRALNEESIVTRVARTGEVLNLADVRTSPTYIRARASTQSEAAVPLRIDDEIIGVLDVEDDALGAFGERDVKLLTAFAHKVATAIRQVRLFEQVSRGKEEWETTFNAMKDAIFIFDRECQIARMNTAAEELFDWETKKGKGPNAVGYFLSNDELVHRALNDKETVSVEIDCPPLNRLFNFTIYPIFDEGAAIGAVKIVRDLTQLRSAEREARENQEFAAELVENAYDAIYTLDLHGRFNWLNHQTSQVTGYSNVELNGRSLSALVIGEDAENFRFHFTQAAQGQPQGCEVRVAHKDGSIRTWLATLTPFRRHQRIVGVLCIARDVTEQRQVQINSARADKLHALGELASGVAHDFNNILAAILGRAQLLKVQTQDERMQRSLDVIAQAALDGGNTIKRIQNFARRRADHDFVIHDLHSLLTDVVDITRTRWKDESERVGRHINVELDLLPELFVAGDATELREVFINLIINAVDALPQGGLIRITTETENGEARIRFRDNGQGIPEDIRNRIFDPFFSTKGSKGTGLGLSISYGIIARHDGRIEVDSKSGEGTTFAITLPIAADTIQVAPKPFEHRRADPAVILVVDDEETVREILVEILEAEGHTVFSADSGRGALKLLSQHTFNLVLTDLGMPEMNGWEVAKSVKLHNPALPVLMTTGWGEEIDREQAAHEGVDQIVCKPFQLDELLNLIADVLHCAHK